MAEGLAVLLAVCEKAARSKFPVTIDPVAVLPVVRRAAALIEQQAASLAAKDKEIERLSQLLNSEQMALTNAESRAEQAERALAETRAHLAMRNSDLVESRRALAEAVEVMRPFASREMQDFMDEVDNYGARYQSQWFADSLAAASAFIQQHQPEVSK